MSMEEELQEFGADWTAAWNRVLERRQNWNSYVDTHLKRRLEAVKQYTQKLGILIIPMDHVSEGRRHTGLRLDTRETGITYKTRDGGQVFVHEELADLVFDQRPSGLVWVIRWQPYIKGISADPPGPVLARDFDPANAIDNSALDQDIIGFLKWALDNSYRGQRVSNEAGAGEPQEISPQIAGFVPGDIGAPAK